MVLEANEAQTGIIVVTAVGDRPPPPDPGDKVLPLVVLAVVTTALSFLPGLLGIDPPGGPS